MSVAVYGAAVGGSGLPCRGCGYGSGMSQTAAVPGVRVVLTPHGRHSAPEAFVLCAVCQAKLSHHLDAVATGRALARLGSLAHDAGDRLAALAGAAEASVVESDAPTPTRPSSGPAVATTLHVLTRE